MSGDWIKMRGNLWDDPRVGRVVDLTATKEATVIGALYWLWATADQHTEDGCMPGLSMQQIDRKTGVKGFAAALVAVDWIHDDPQGVVIARFEEHNGKSAKKRLETARRVAKHRAGNSSEPPEDPGSNAESVTGALARESVTGALARVREEKRREEIQGADTAPLPLRAQPEPGTEGQQPTPAGLACRAMRDAGMADVNPGDPRLMALLEQGASAEELRGVAADAVTRGKGFAWALKALEGRRADAAAISLAAPPPATVASAEPVKTAALIAEMAQRAADARSPESQQARRDALAKLGRAAA